VVLDPDTVVGVPICDPGGTCHAVYTKKGIELVIVNGEIVLDAE